MAAVNLVIRASTGLISILISEIMRFQNLGKSQHENCQFCAPLTNITMSQVEKSHISGPN